MCLVSIPIPILRTTLKSTPRSTTRTLNERTTLRASVRAPHYLHVNAGRAIIRNISSCYIVELEVEKRWCSAATRSKESSFFILRDTKPQQ